MEKLLLEIKSIIDNTNNIDFKDLKKELDGFLNNKIKGRNIITKCKRKKIVRPPLFISDSSSDSN